MQQAVHVHVGRLECRQPTRQPVQLACGLASLLAILTGLTATTIQPAPPPTHLVLLWPETAATRAAAPTRMPSALGSPMRMMQRQQRAATRSCALGIAHRCLARPARPARRPGRAAATGGDGKDIGKKLGAELLDVVMGACWGTPQQRARVVGGARCPGAHCPAAAACTAAVCSWPQDAQVVSDTCTRRWHSRGLKRARLQLLTHALPLQVWPGERAAT